VCDSVPRSMCIGGSFTAVYGENDASDLRQAAVSLETHLTDRQTETDIHTHTPKGLLGIPVQFLIMQSSNQPITHSMH